MIEIDSNHGRIGNFCWHNSVLKPRESVDWPGSGHWLIVASWGFCTFAGRSLTRHGWRIEAKPLSPDAWAW